MSGSGESTALALVLQGDEPRTIPLPEAGRLVLGSSASLAGFLVEGQGVEDAHCAVGRLKDGGWAIQDLGSRYGTRVNGRKVASARLAAGDAVVVGSRRLEVRVAEDGAAPAGSRDAQDTGEASQFLPGFRLERLLGRGGMGEVHLALQESLGRHVAVKVLSPKLTRDRAFVQRFHSEARAAAALSHPNVVVVHDVGEAGGRHYLVMEYMPGGSLEERLARQGRIPWRELLGVLQDAASGLTYAEEQRIVHRDIKPDNLMIAASGAVKIADLGLASPVSESVADNGDDGRPAGRNYGTPHFLSPEQARGGPLDHRSDLYSLGATAYRLLTGRTPFQGNTAREIIRARFTQAPVPPSQLVPDVPPELEALVLRLMEVDPAQRPASAQELLHEVGRMRLEAEHGGSATATSPPRSRGSFVRILVALVVPVLAVAGYLLFGPEPPPPAEPIEEPQSAVSPFDPGGEAFDAGLEDEGAFFGTGERRALDPDEERELEAMELEARVALGRVPQGEGRIAALEDLVERFAPTRVAAEARAELERLRARALEERVARAQRELEADEALERLRTTAGWPPRGDAPPRLGEILARIDRYQVSLAVASNPLYTEGRDALMAEILSTGLERMRASLAGADALVARGAFDDLERLYAELDRCLDLPAMDLGEALDPLVLGALRELAHEVDERRARLGSDAASFATRLAAEDRAAIGRAFGPGSGLLEELGALRVDAALTRAQACDAELATPRGRERLGPFLARLEEARAALAMLGESLAGGAWRRTRVVIPGPRRTERRDAVALSEAGLRVAADEEHAAETIPWSRFTSATDALHDLVERRLVRDYTPAEERSVLALLTLSAVQLSVRPALAHLDPERRALVDPQAAQAARSAFDGVRAWLEAHPRFDEEPESRAAAESARREMRAAELVVRALTAAQEGAWTLASTTTERLLTEYQDTLVVCLLSDGRPLPAPEPAGTGGG